MSTQRKIRRRLNLECGGKVLRTPLSFPIDSSTSQSGVAEYLAAALQIKTPPKIMPGTQQLADRFIEMYDRDCERQHKEP